MMTISFTNFDLTDELKQRANDFIKNFLYCKVTDDKIVVTLYNTDRENIFLYATLIKRYLNIMCAAFEVHYPAFTKVIDVKVDENGKEQYFAVMGIDPADVTKLKQQLFESGAISKEAFTKAQNKWRKINGISATQEKLKRQNANEV